MALHLVNLDFGHSDFGHSTLNYFSYFSEIEDTFVRRRGKHLMLSPIDWALIESWKERGVPLHVALRGIEHAFDSHDAKKQKRTVKTLLYCQEEVEAQYAEWLESRVGSQDDRAQTAVEEDQKSPFPRDVVLKYLDESLQELNRLSDQRVREDDELTEALSRARTLLAEIREDYARAAAPNSRKLEESLTGLERMLSDALRLVMAPQIEEIRTEVSLQLKPYRRQMEKEIYDRTVDNLLLKRLRETFGVPRLSLFHL
jgi:hypothetical protein